MPTPRHHFCARTTDDEFLGEIFCRLDRASRRAGLDIKFVPRAQGRGFARDALLTLIDWVFGTLPEADAVWTEPRSDNLAARTLYYSCGLRETERPAGMHEADSYWERRRPAIVRPMSIADAARVAELSGQLGYPVDPDEIARRIRLLSKDPDSAVLVAESIDGEVLGWIHVLGRHFIESAPSAEVIGLVVDSAVRRRGVGEALLAAAERWAMEQGFARMRIRSNTVRQEARPFYLKNGYTIAKTQYVFQRDLPGPNP